MHATTPAATRPVVVRHRVLWGDCDPAGVVYTPRFSDYLVLARDGFMRAVLGFSEGSGMPPGLSFPLRALAFDFRSPLRPGERFDMTARCTKVGTTSFETEVTAVSEAGDLVFVASCTTVCIDPARRRSVRLPDAVAAALDAELAR